MEKVNGRVVHQYNRHLGSDVIPIGTKYMNFSKVKDLQIGTEVVAKVAAFEKRGMVTEILDHTYCAIDGEKVLISNIEYTILK